MKCSRLNVSLGLCTLAATFAPLSAYAEAGFLSKGDVSLGLTTVVESFNTYWYYQGPETPLPYDLYRDPTEHNNLGLGNYGLEDLGTQINLVNTGFRFEFGLTDNVALWGETGYVSGSIKDSDTYATKSIADSKLGIKVALTRNSPVVASLLSSIKIPGLYEIQAPYSPGEGQPDWDIKLAIGGLTMRRRMFYDVGLGYRVRFPYASPAEFPYTVNADDTAVFCDPSSTYCEYDVYFPLDGPSNETFADATIGYFTSRRSMVFFNLNGVDSHKGISWDDYSAASSAVETPAGENPSAWQLFPEFEEDYLRMGVGFLFRPAPSWSAYANYSYTVLGKNTAGVFRTASGLPVGALALGVEFTFGTGQGSGSAASPYLDPNEILAMDFSQPSALR